MSFAGPEDRSRKYAREKYALYFINILLTVIFLCAYQCFLSAYFKNISYAVFNDYFLALFVYLIFFVICQYIVSLPLHFYASFMLEHKYGLSNQSISDWIKDEIKKGMISMPFFIAMGMLFYALLRKSGGLWWIYLAVAWLLFSVVFARVMPTLIIPLFYKYSDISNQGLKNRIKKLAHKSRIKLEDIFKIDFSRKTKKANAAVVGMGSSRRVLLTDTLLENFTDGEIETVCAHEFGHHKMGHMKKMIASSCAVTAIGFFVLSAIMGHIRGFVGAGSIYDIVMFPSFLLFMHMYGLTVMPVSKWYSRMLERQSDKYALESISDKNDFISLMRKLSKMNLSDEDPPKIIKYLFFDHPPIKERIKLARKRV